MSDPKSTSLDSTTASSSTASKTVSTTKMQSKQDNITIGGGQSKLFSQTKIAPQPQPKGIEKSQSKSMIPVAAGKTQSLRKVQNFPTAREKSMTMRDPQTSAVAQMTKKSAFIPSKMRSMTPAPQAPPPPSSTTTTSAPASALQIIPYKAPGPLQKLDQPPSLMSKTETLGSEIKSSTEPTIETRETLSIKISHGKESTQITQVVEKKSPSWKRRKRSPRSPGSKRSPPTSPRLSIQTQPQQQQQQAIKGPQQQLLLMPPPPGQLTKSTGLTTTSKSDLIPITLPSSKEQPASGIIALSSTDSTGFDSSKKIGHVIPLVDETSRKISIRKTPPAAAAAAAGGKIQPKSPKPPSSPPKKQQVAKIEQPKAKEQQIPPTPPPAASIKIKPKSKEQQKPPTPPRSSSPAVKMEPKKQQQPPSIVPKTPPPPPPVKQTSFLTGVTALKSPIKLTPLSFGDIVGGIGSRTSSSSSLPSKTKSQKSDKVSITRETSKSDSSGGKVERIHAKVTQTITQKSRSQKIREERLDLLYSCSLHFLAQIIGCSMLILLAILCIQFYGGFGLGNVQSIFNYHPLMMVFGLVYLGGNSLLFLIPKSKSYGLIRSILLLLMCIVTIIGAIATVYWHFNRDVPNFFTLHSWFGMMTLTLMIIYSCANCYLFGSGGGKRVLQLENNESIESITNIRLIGISTLLMGVLTGLLGLNQLSSFIQADKDSEENSFQLIINIIGTFMILFSIFILFLLSRLRTRSKAQQEWEERVQMAVDRAMANMEASGVFDSPKSPAAKKMPKSITTLTTTKTSQQSKQQKSDSKIGAGGGSGQKSSSSKSGIKRSSSKSSSSSITKQKSKSKSQKSFKLRESSTSLGGISIGSKSNASTKSETTLGSTIPRRRRSKSKTTGSNSTTDILEKSTKSLGKSNIAKTGSVLKTTTVK
ncbi:hypothetical protein DERP_003477 [Dermatophagoides pteronyssinus]|uniref:Cytochrome b561 domain-containing protein n=1 Tax=Dermatophagoides pteronyssinus TaxID=6956 RepID=A0ABQ8JKR0_DERPT|nr:hypothetical protein DERP_003477 [Dermatophagoides pteronyssinus]